MDDRRFDVFLSYNSADRPIVERVAQRLVQERIEPWWDQWNLTAGKSWQEEIVAGLQASKTCAVFVGSVGLGDWAREELHVAQDRAAKDRDFRLFMVLLPGAPEPDHPSLAFLRSRTWVELRDGLAGPNGIDDLLAAITGTSRRHDVVVAPGRCPYRGLEAFDEDHAEFYFGRDHDIALSLAKLRSKRLLTVLGPSGSGKSSLLRAGVVPAVRRGAVHGSETWPVRIFTPGPRPLTVLAAQLSRLFPTQAMQQTLDQLQQDQRTLDLAVSLAFADQPAGDCVVLVVDQFEEVFTLCRNDEERQAFVSNLRYASSIPGGRVVVLIGMRADFYQRCAPYADLRAMLEEPLLVGPLDAEGLRRAIEEPAAGVGLELESGLTATILASVIDRPGALPLLEHVLTRLWELRRGRMLTLAAYVSTGGVEGALEKQANEIYEGFTERQKEIARRVLLRLVHPGENAEDTRRRAEMDEIASLVEDPDDVATVVGSLTDQRLLTVWSDVEGKRVVEITHEALIRGWPQLRIWLNENRENLRAQRRLTELAEEWHRGGRSDDSLLYTGARLAAWQERLDRMDRSELTAVELAFLDTSARATQRAEEERDAARLARERLLVERPLARAGEAVFELDQSPERALLLALAAVQEASESSVVQRAVFRVFSGAKIDRVLRGHTDRISSVDWHPGGQVILSGSYDRTARVWDPRSGEALGILGSHDDAITCVAWSHDGTLVVTGGWDGVARIWDVRSRSVSRTLRGHGDWVSSVRWSSDDRMIATGSLDKTARLWDVASGRTVQVLEGHTEWVRSAEWGPDDDQILTGSYDGTAGLWDAGTGERLGTLAGHRIAVPAVAWSPTGHEALTASEDGTVRVWDMADRRTVRRLRVAVSPVYDIELNPWSQTALTCGEDGIVRQWDLENGTLMSEMPGHGGWVSGVAWAPDGNRAVSGGEDATLRIVDLKPRFGEVVGRHHALISSVSWHPDMSHVASAGGDGLVTIWPVGAGGLPGPGHSIPIEAVVEVAWSPDGRTLASGTSTGGVALWDTGSWSCKADLLGHHDRISRIAWSGDGQEFLTGSHDGTVRVWNARTATSVAVLERGEQISDVAWNPVRRQALVAPWSEAAFLWPIPVDSTDLQPVTALKGHSTVLHSADWSPDGSMGVTTSGDGTARIWDCASGEEVRRLRAGEAFTSAWNPRGHRVLTGSRDGVVRIWDVDSGADVMLLRHPDSVHSARWSPDGTQVVSGCDDGAVRTWAIDPAAVVGELSERVARIFSAEEIRREIPGWSGPPSPATPLTPPTVDVG
jgi:WD40 repeat protein